jgi:hypothetical protein
MAIELWVALLAGLLLLLTIVAEALHAVQGHQRWKTLALGAEAGAAIILGIALFLTASRVGGWQPVDLRQAAWSLALATVGVHLGLGWLTGARSAGLVVGLMALALTLLGSLFLPSDSPTACIEFGSLFYLEWTLFFVGAGGAAVAGNGGLASALQWGMHRRESNFSLPRSRDLHMLTAQAANLSLVALGAGLTVAVWRGWQAAGRPTSGDPREDWMAITLLIVVMSHLAWQLERQAGRWAAGLAVVAAAVALLGLLAVPGLSWLLAP